MADLKLNVSNLSINIVLYINYKPSKIPRTNQQCKSHQLFRGYGPLRPPLGRALTQRFPGLVSKPVLGPLHVADLGVLGAVLEEAHPVQQALVDAPQRVRALLLLQRCQLLGAPVRVDLGVVERQVHLLDPAHVGCPVLREAPCYVAPRRVHAREVTVRAIRAVRAPVRGHVVDGAVDGEV